MLELKLLLLLIVANGAPVLGKRLLREHWDTPVDFGCTLPDGQPLFGNSKTWRGLLFGTLASASLQPLLSWPLYTILTIALSALIGDLLSSFIKRRLQLPSSSRAPLLDQLPEALLPLLISIPLLNSSPATVLLVCSSFLLLHIGLSPLLYRLGIRHQPH